MPVLTLIKVEHSYLQATNQLLNTSVPFTVIESDTDIQQNLIAFFGAANVAIVPSAQQIVGSLGSDHRYWVNYHNHPFDQVLTTLLVKCDGAVVLPATSSIGCTSVSPLMPVYTMFIAYSKFTN